MFGSRVDHAVLFLQILTGVGLALFYVPSADKAYDSLLYLNYEADARLVFAGPALLRRLGHGRAGAGAHDAGLSARGVQVSARAHLGLGVFLLLCTLGMFLRTRSSAGTRTPTGALAVGGSMAGQVPGRAVGGSRALGRPGNRRRLAQPVLRPARLRDPGALLFFLAVHLGWCQAGSAPRPSPGKMVDPKTYDADYEKQLENRRPVSRATP